MMARRKWECRRVSIGRGGPDVTAHHGLYGTGTASMRPAFVQRTAGATEGPASQAPCHERNWLPHARISLHLIDIVCAKVEPLSVHTCLPLALIETSTRWMSGGGQEYIVRDRERERERERKTNER